ncbi:hypothetical protein FKP32DRAFT_1672082 [Trametes sanguinea]|nr:hypothetical protein FKP32DRAFT_1672082 [Trametes sanguinea]
MNNPNGRSLPTLQVLPSAHLVPQARGGQVAPTNPVHSGYPGDIGVRNATSYSQGPSGPSFIPSILGLSGPSESWRRARQVLVKLTLCLIAAIVHLALTIYLMVRGIVHTTTSDNETEFRACQSLAVMNWAWLFHTVVWCYLLLWAYYTTHRRSLSPEGDISSLICPMTVASFHVLASRVLVYAITLLYLGLSIGFLLRSNKRCFSSAPDVTALSLVNVCGTPLCFLLGYVIGLYLPLAVDSPSGSSLKAFTKAEIARIPLVLYIPSPPDDLPASPTTPNDHPSPQSPSFPPPARVSRRSTIKRFIFLQPRPQRNDGDVECGFGTMEMLDAQAEWESNWAPAAYPFIRLPDNLATCAICREDFQAPKRISDVLTSPTEEAPEMTAIPSPGAVIPRAAMNESCVRIERPHAADAAAMQLVDAGAQPLRLLSCGHAYHKDCVDQWLLRRAQCPTCRVHVEIPPPPRESKRSLWK